MQKLFFCIIFSFFLISNSIQSKSTTVIYTSDDPEVAAFVLKSLGNLFSSIGKVLSTAECKVNYIDTRTEVHTDVLVPFDPSLLVFCAAVLICYKYLSDKAAEAKSVKQNKYNNQSNRYHYF